MEVFAVKERATTTDSAVNLFRYSRKTALILPLIKLASEQASNAAFPRVHDIGKAL